MQNNWSHDPRVGCVVSSQKNGSVDYAECGVRSVENEECGRCGVWKMRSVENAECRNFLILISIPMRKNSVEEQPE